MSFVSYISILLLASFTGGVTYLQVKINLVATSFACSIHWPGYLCHFRLSITRWTIVTVDTSCHHLQTIIAPLVDKINRWLYLPTYYTWLSLLILLVNDYNLSFSDQSIKPLWMLLVLSINHSNILIDTIRLDFIQYYNVNLASYFTWLTVAYYSHQ